MPEAEMGDGRTFYSIGKHFAWQREQAPAQQFANCDGTGI
jgi:hypothetical protein